MLYRTFIATVSALTTLLLVACIARPNTAYAAGANDPAPADGTTAQPKSLSQLRSAAEQGDANAQHDLGLKYSNGQGVPKNNKKAAYWFGKAAAQGEPRSQYDLGLQYYQGQGVKKNYKKAAALFEKAAEQGETHAQLMLGTAYFNGQGVSRNYPKAAHWLAKAADGGDAQAQLILGVMYLKPLGVKRNLVVSAKWFMLAESSSDKTYSTKASKALTELKHAMSHAQIAEAERSAAEWRSTHHED